MSGLDIGVDRCILPGMSKSLYPKFGETAGLKNGDRVVVSYEGVSASGDFVAGIGQQRFCVTLDGTGKMVTVDGWMITREKAGA